MCSLVSQVWPNKKTVFVCVLCFVLCVLCCVCVCKYSCTYIFQHTLTHTHTNKRTLLVTLVYMSFLLFNFSLTPCYIQPTTDYNVKTWNKNKTNKMTTFNGGSLGSCIDEERSKLRYVMWIAELSESSNLWTQLALLGIPGSMPVWVSLT